MLMQPRVASPEEDEGQRKIFYGGKAMHISRNVAHQTYINIC